MKFNKTIKISGIIAIVVTIVSFSSGLITIYPVANKFTSYFQDKWISPEEKWKSVNSAYQQWLSNSDYQHTQKLLSAINNLNQLERSKAANNDDYMKILSKELTLKQDIQKSDHRYIPFEKELNAWTQNSSLAELNKIIKAYNQLTKFDQSRLSGGQKIQMNNLLNAQKKTIWAELEIALKNVDEICKLYKEETKQQNTIKKAQKLKDQINNTPIFLKDLTNHQRNIWQQINDSQSIALGSCFQNRNFLS